MRQAGDRHARRSLERPVRVRPGERHDQVLRLVAVAGHLDCLPVFFGRSRRCRPLDQEAGLPGHALLVRAGTGAVGVVPVVRPDLLHLQRGRGQLIGEFAGRSSIIPRDACEETVIDCIGKRITLNSYGNRNINRLPTVVIGELCLRHTIGQLHDLIIDLHHPGQMLECAGPGVVDVAVSQCLCKLIVLTKNLAI